MPRLVKTVTAPAPAVRYYSEVSIMVQNLWVGCLCSYKDLDDCAVVGVQDLRLTLFRSAVPYVERTS